MARAQFLALFLSMFLMRWTDGSTGSLLPRIQVFKLLRDLTYTLFPLQCTVSAVYFRHDTRCCRDSLQDIQGKVVVALVNMPNAHSDRLGLGNVSF